MSVVQAQRGGVQAEVDFQQRVQVYLHIQRHLARVEVEPTPDGKRRGVGRSAEDVRQCHIDRPREQTEEARQIEGVWQPGERVVIIAGLLTSGGSVIQSAEVMRAAGLVVEDVVVLIDREQGGVDKLAAAGLRAHSVFKISEMLDTLVDARRLDEAKRREVLAYISQQA